MGEIGAMVTSPAWWFGTVVVALLINLLSAPVAKQLSRGLERVNKTWKERSERSRAEFHAKVQYLMHSPVALAAARHDEITGKLSSVFLLLGGVLIVALSIAIPFLDDRHDKLFVKIVTMGFTLLGGLLAFAGAWKFMDIAEEAAPASAARTELLLMEASALARGLTATDGRVE